MFLLCKNNHACAMSQQQTFGCLFTCLFTPACVNLFQYTFEAYEQENYQLPILLKLTVLYFPSIERFTNRHYLHNL